MINARFYTALHLTGLPALTAGIVSETLPMRRKSKLNVDQFDRINRKQVRELVCSWNDGLENEIFKLIKKRLKGKQSFE